jgi:hypothetical protein
MIEVLIHNGDRAEVPDTGDPADAVRVALRLIEESKIGVQGERGTATFLVGGVAVRSNIGEVELRSVLHSATYTGPTS